MILYAGSSPLSEISYEDWERAPKGPRKSLSKEILEALVSKPRPMSEIADMLGRPEQPIYNTLQKLIKKGLVARRPMRVAGREVYVYGLVKR